MVAFTLWGLLGPNPVSHNGHRPGFTLDKLPGISRLASFGFSILLLLRSSARIQTCDLLFTSPPALPTELQRPVTVMFMVVYYFMLFLMFIYFDNPANALANS